MELDTFFLGLLFVIVSAVTNMASAQHHSVSKNSVQNSPCYTVFFTSGPELFHVSQGGGVGGVSHILPCHKTVWP